ncbi:MAG: hypothetical protein ABSD57_07525 [Verrucomicrobiota bacterium]|jgi:hypothetical protein
MKKGVPLIAVLLLLFRFVAAGQPSPALQIVNANGNAALSWTGGSVPLFSLQTTTNLLPPIMWTDLLPVAGTGNTNVPMANSQQFFRLAQVLPIFQFAIFYNLDLEVDPGGYLAINAPAFCNGGIWSGTPNVSYLSTVAAVGKVYYAPNNGTDPFCSGKVDSGGAGSGTPIGNFAYPPLSGAGPLTLVGFGTNTSSAATRSILDLPPPACAMGTPAAYSPTGAVYLANAADLYLTNFPNGTNWTTLTPRGTNMILYYQDAANGPDNYLTSVPYDFYITTNVSPAHHGLSFTNYVPASQWTNSIGETNRIWYAGYSFVTNAIFYDWREGWNAGNGPPKTVQAVQIDIAKFNSWLTNTAANNGGKTYNDLCQLPSHKSHPIDSIFVYNAVPLTATTLPTARVVNGGMLPSQTAPYGFTVVTPMPLYVYGNYNVSNSLGSSLGQNSTTYTWPAALMADAITILSTNWLDANSAPANKAVCTSGGPTPKTTTVNAAMLEGIVPSTNGIYSGGLENFLRLLENWSGGVPLWYNGSFIVMFPSQYATNYQQITGKYYNAPVRCWAFDTNFVQLAGLPPLTPTVVNDVTP